jgi:hypothetical protein
MIFLFKNPHRTCAARAVRHPCPTEVVYFQHKKNALAVFFFVFFILSKWEGFLVGGASGWKVSNFKLGH